MLVRLSETFLFCIKTTAINKALIIISDIVKTVVNISYFLNSNEYKIFKIVKIATAIIKFTAQFIW
jgi:hypothetical protein